MKHRGSCHCGKVSFEVEGEIKEALSCNCSICARKGSLLWFVPRTAFNLSTGEGETTLYQFNKHNIEHLFCKTCGVQSYAFGKDPRGNEMAAINIRCLENFEFQKIPVKHFNGRDL